MSRWRWAWSYLVVFAFLNLIEFSGILIHLVRFGYIPDPPHGYWLVWLAVVPLISLALTPAVAEYLERRDVRIA